MKNALVAGCVIALLGLLGTPVQAQFCCFPLCPPPCCVTYELRPVMSYQAVWQEEKVPCVVQRVNYRKELTPVRTQVWVPTMVEENVRTSYYVPVPREVERDVWRCISVPMVMVDPCTCCCYVWYCPQWVSEKVRCMVYDYRTEEREDRVKVCRWVQQERMVDQVRWVPEVTQEQSWTVRRTCAWVPCQTMVCVPVWCR